MSARQLERPRYTLSKMRLIQRGPGSQCDTVCANLDFMAPSWFLFMGIILTVYSR